MAFRWAADSHTTVVDVLTLTGIPKRLGVGIALMLAMASMSCTPMAAGIDRFAGGPTAPVDTAITPHATDADPLQEAPARPLPPGPLKITIPEAILLSLENNRALMAERLNPAIVQTTEDLERALFDPVIGGEVAVEREKGERQARSGSQTESFTADNLGGLIFLEQYFPTGTAVTLEATSDRADSTLYDNPFYASRLGLTMTQALLRGFGPQVNLVRLRQARLDTRMSAFALRGFTESLVAEVELTYWDYALARRRIEIVEESLKVARQQLSETEELIAVGRLAPAERAAVQAEGWRALSGSVH